MKRWAEGPKLRDEPGLLRSAEAATDTDQNDSRLLAEPMAHLTALLPLVLDNVPQGLRAALEQEGVPTCTHTTHRAAGRFVLFDSRKRRPGWLLPEQKAIDIAPLCEGFCEDPFAALLDTGSERCCWSLEDGDVCERVARVDKRVVRYELLGRLRRRIERAGGVWIRLAAYPFPYRSMFCFRIDYDEYDPVDYDTTLAAIAGHEGATSHFVNGASYVTAGGALAQLAGLDVGSHGYWHHTYRTQRENLSNIRRGIEVLRAAGLAPVGFVAPHGELHSELSAALESLGILFSSEFGFAYDELPMFPSGNNVLQIPVHPVSLGIFFEALSANAEQVAIEAAADRATAYFDQLVRARHHAGEPALLYGHPTGRLGRFPRVLRSPIETAARLGSMWSTTLSQIERWWRARLAINLRVWNEGRDLIVSADRDAPGFRLAIEYLRGEHVATLPLDRGGLRFSPTALAFEKRRAEFGVRPTRLPSDQSLRGRFRRWIDWERTTPVEEIPIDSIRNWTKRRLRALLRSA